jgi:hypothetical protein
MAAALDPEGPVLYFLFCQEIMRNKKTHLKTLCLVDTLFVILLAKNLGTGGINKEGSHIHLSTNGSMTELELNYSWWNLSHLVLPTRKKMQLMQ